MNKLAIPNKPVIFRLDIGQPEPDAEAEVESYSMRVSTSGLRKIFVAESNSDNESYYNRVRARISCEKEVLKKPGEISWIFHLESQGDHSDRIYIGCYNIFEASTEDGESRGKLKLTYSSSDSSERHLNFKVVKNFKFIFLYKKAVTVLKDDKEVKNFSESFMHLTPIPNQTFYYNCSNMVQAVQDRYVYWITPTSGLVCVDTEAQELEMDKVAENLLAFWINPQTLQRTILSKTNELIVGDRKLVADLDSVVKGPFWIMLTQVNRSFLVTGYYPEKSQNQILQFKCVSLQHQCSLIVEDCAGRINY